MSFPNTALSVNVNKVALLRNTRHLGIPSVTRAATLCLQAGAHGITVHPRPDQRHIRALYARQAALKLAGAGAPMVPGAPVGIALVRGISPSGLARGCEAWVWKLRICERIEVTEWDICNGSRNRDGGVCWS